MFCGLFSKYWRIPETQVYFHRQSNEIKRLGRKNTKKRRTNDLRRQQIEPMNHRKETTERNDKKKNKEKETNRNEKFEEKNEAIQL